MGRCRWRLEPLNRKRRQRTLFRGRWPYYNRRMMSETSSTPNLCAKIARLVEERGWNQEEFARQADLNRLTVRSIIQGGQRKLHNATVCACARALGLSVNDLRNLPLERLLPRMHTPATARENLRRLYEKAAQPELIGWIE